MGAVVAVSTLCISLISWLIITRLRIGAIVSPLSITIFVLVSIYAIRPILMIGSENYFLYGTSIRRGFEYSTWVGLVAVVSMICGFSFLRLQKPKQVEGEFVQTRRPRAIDGKRVIPMAAAAAMAAVAAWIGSQLLIGGGSAYLAELFAGRSELNEEAQSGVPAVVDTLPMIGALIVCLARLEVQRARKLLTREHILFWLAIAACVVPPTALGIRRYLIPTLLGALIAVVAPRWTSILRLRWAVALGVAFVALVSIPFVRSEGSRTQSSSFTGALLDYIGGQGVGGAMYQYFTSYDTEMFSYVALIRQNHLEGFHLGSGQWLLGDLFIETLPASLSVQSFSNELLTYNFGGGCGNPYCPVPSLPGVLVADFGLAGVAIGMFALGLLFQRVEPSRTFSMQGFAPVAFVLWCAVPTIVRGNSVRLLSIYLQAAVVVVVACYLLVLIQRSSSAGRPRAPEGSPSVSRRVMN